MISKSQENSVGSSLGEINTTKTGQKLTARKVYSEYSDLLAANVNFRANGKMSAHIQNHPGIL